MLRDYWGACTSLTYSVPRSTLRRLVYASLFLHLVFSSLPRRVRPIHRVRQPWLAASANNHPCCRPPGAFMGFYRHFDISREMCALSPIHSPFAVPYAVLADKSRIQSIESSRAFPAPYTTLRPSRPFQVILVTAEALRFVERRRGRRSATAPPPNPAPPYAVLADVRSSASALSVRRVPDAAARTDGRRCLCSWTSRRRAPPRRSPAYSPSSPAARGSVAPWPSFVASPIASRRYAWRYELLLGEVSRPPLRHLTSRPPYAVLADVRSSASTLS